MSLFEACQGPALAPVDVSQCVAIERVVLMANVVLCLRNHEVLETFRLEDLLLNPISQQSASP